MHVTFSAPFSLTFNLHGILGLFAPDIFCHAVAFFPSSCLFLISMPHCWKY